jgi:translation elongation factor EF-Tu-like GTPase
MNLKTVIRTGLFRANALAALLSAITVSAALAQVQQQMDAGGKTLPPGTTSAQAAGADADPGVFSMTILDFFDIAGKGVVVAGGIDTGTVRVGDTVCLLSAKAGKRELRVESIELGRLTPESATAGDMPGIVLNGITTLDLSRNDQLRSTCPNH